MRPNYNRKTSPKVIGGHVQRKNNHVKTARLGYVVDRVSPGRGFVHVISKKDIHDFTDIIPDWGKVSEGIESIFLAEEEEYADAFYKHYSREETGVIWLCAWQDDLWIEHSDEYYQEHSWILKKLGVVCEKSERSIEDNETDKMNDNEDLEKETYWTCYFSMKQAKAFMLLHVFLHELGHHVDKLRSKKRNVMAGGEGFAENYANRRFYELWPAYVERFGNPCISQ